VKSREKTKEQLLEDLASLRRKLTAVRKAEAVSRRREEALRAENERLTGFMRSATEALVILDEELNILDFNEIALGYLPPGTPREEVIGKNVLDFVPYLRDTPRYERYRGIIRNGGVYQEDVVLFPGPEQRYLSIRAFRAGKGLGIVATDVTERKRAEEALRESEEKYHRLAEIAEEGIAIHDQGVIIEANEALARMFGYELSEMIGTYAARYATPETWELILKKIAAGYTEPYEGRGVKKDGSTFWVELRGKPVLYKGKPVRVTVFRDITERKRAEEKITRLNSALWAIRNVNQLLAREKDRDALIRGVCAKLVESGRYRGAWIVLMDEAGALLGAAEAGYPGGFREFLESFGGRVPPCVTAVRHREGVLTVSHRHEICRLCPGVSRWGEFEASCVRLEGAGRVYGALCVYSPPGMILDEEEQSLLSELAGDVALGLHTIAVEEEKGRAVRAMQLADERLHAVIEAAPAILWALDPDGTITFSEGRALEALGLKGGELVGRSVFEVYKNAPEAMHFLRRALKGEEFTAETVVGDRVWSNRYVPRRDGEGNITGVIGVSVDITERRRAEEAVRESEARFRALVENSADGLAVIRPDGTIAYLGPSNDRILGYGPGENAPARTIFDYIHPDDHPRLRDTFARVLAEPGSVIVSDYRCLHKDGTWRTIETTSQNMSHIPSVGGVVVNFRDITERRRAEEALRQREEQLRMIFENVNDVIIRVDERGVVTDCNRRLKDVFGYEPEEVIGKRFNDFPFVDPSFMANLIEEFSKAIATRRTVLLTFEARRKDGRPIFLEASTSRISAPGGGEGALTLIRDTTERRRAEEREREAEKLRELDRMRTELLANVSHELRTPLTTIKGYASMLADYIENLKPEERREYLATIERSADRLNELVESLLDMSRLESGMLRMNRKPNDIGPVLRQAVEEVRVRSPKHMFVLSIPSDLPIVSFDARRIRQVVDNLLDNAVKYSREGTTVTVGVSRSDSELSVLVSDQGIGIPAHELERVFDRMYRIKTPQTARTSGMGLGLAIAKGIVEAHGGRIWMESTEGRGSTCFFTLPLGTEEADHGKGNGPEDDPHH